MGVGKTIWRGVWVTWSQKELVEAKKKKGDFIEFRLSAGTAKIGARTPTGFFISNVLIHQSLVTNRIPDRHPVGSIIMGFDHEFETIEPDYIFPRAFLPALKGTGLGSLAELGVKKVLLKDFWWYDSELSDRPSFERKKQLQKSRGKASGWLPLTEDVKRLEQYVKNQAKKQTQTRPKLGGKSYAPSARKLKRPLPKRRNR